MGLDVYGNSQMPPGDRTVRDGKIQMGGRFHLATLYRKGIAGHFDEVRANARLIAAAPDLLEACKRIAADGHGTAIGDLEFLCAAIAKAERK